MIRCPGGAATLRSSLSEADASFLGIERTDRAGSSITGLGDFDGNGLADFAIGARYGDLGGHNAGQVHLLLSRP